MDAWTTEVDGTIKRGAANRDLCRGSVVGLSLPPSWAGPVFLTALGGTSGLSGLSLGGRPGLASRAPESYGGGPRLVRRLPGGCAWRASLQGNSEGGGGPNGPEDQRTPVAAGPAPLSRMRAICCSISGGTRRSPHHRCPQTAQGSVDCQRAPTCCVKRDRRATLTARRASGALTSSWALGVRASAGDQA